MACRNGVLIFIICLSSFVSFWEEFLISVSPLQMSFSAMVGGIFLSTFCFLCPIDFEKSNVTLSSIVSNKGTCFNTP
jgi:hypothetical protein